MKFLNILLIICFVILSSVTYAQKRKFHLPSFDVIRTGPYIGFQKGIYNNLEFGYEKQWKDLKLFRSRTSALFGGINYNLNYGVIGADVGVWRKLGFLGITYGAAGVYRTNFTFSKVGLTPFVGVKLGRFHLKTGYQFMFPHEHQYGVNEFYISLRFKVWSRKKIKRD